MPITHNAKTVLSHAGDNVDVHIYILGLWRLFAVPCKPDGTYKGFKTYISAKRGAERVADALGIKLRWKEA